jgi:hypothetical protein
MGAVALWNVPTGEALPGNSAPIQAFRTIADHDPWANGG